MCMSADETPSRADECRACPAPDGPRPSESPEEARARRLLWDIGFCGQYLHFHSGGRSGRAAIICLLAKNGGQMSQQELGTFFELKPGSLSEILAKIENAGLIERSRNPEDRRQLTIRLTGKGIEEAAREQEGRNRFRRQAFACLNETEQEQLLDMLDKIRTHWEGLHD